MPGKYFNCEFCGKRIFRDQKRINESNQRGWNFFCSQLCLFKFRTTSKRYYCSRPNCGRSFLRSPGEFKNIKRCFCSNSCAATFNNSQRPRKVKAIRYCIRCKVNILHKGKKYCSNHCQRLGESISKGEIIGLINNFVGKEQRIPLKREFKHYHAASLRFGTWNNAIKAAGYDPNPVRFANKHIAKDGHKCDSFAEKIIDDWLYIRGIKHERSVPYPSNPKFSCDFVIGSKWVEFFGLKGELATYDHVNRRKLYVARKSEVDLIKVYPVDLLPKSKLRKVFSFALQKM